MWLDQLDVTVDGKQIQTLKPFERKILRAENDKEFDLGSKVTIETKEEFFAHSQLLYDEILKHGAQ